MSRFFDPKNVLDLESLIFESHDPSEPLTVKKSRVIRLTPGNPMGDALNRSISAVNEAAELLSREFRAGKARHQPIEGDCAREISQGSSRFELLNYGL